MKPWFYRWGPLLITIFLLVLTVVVAIVVGGHAQD